MAIQAKTKRFLIDLSHVDAGAYGQLDLRIAQQPSETDSYLLTRLLAYCFLYREDEGSVLQFSKGGLTTPEEPALSRVTLDGRLTLWAEVGLPSGERLHKASKAAPQLVLFSHHEPNRLIEELSKSTIHRKEDLEIWSINAAWLNELSGILGERGGNFSLTIAESVLYVSIEAASLSTELVRVTLGGEG